MYAYFQIAIAIILAILFIFRPKVFRQVYSTLNKIPKMVTIIVAILLFFGVRVYNPFEPPVNPDLEYVAEETSTLPEETPQLSLKTPTKEKRNVSSETKRLVAIRQNWKCGICGRDLDETFEVDHVIPLYKGGSNGIDNLMALDPICHRKKTRADRLGLKLKPVGKPDKSRL